VAAVGKQGLVLLVVAFAAFYLLTEPEGAADAIRGAFGAVMEAFEQIVRFISRLFA